MTVIYATLLPDGSHDLKFRFDPDAVERIKEQPSEWRSWRRADKTWNVSRAAWPFLRESLRRGGHVVSDEASPRFRDSDEHGNWADGLFAALPSHLHSAVYKALSRALHPDIGGDPAAMQALNASYDKMRGAA
jgi:hypothetical protein